MAEVLLEARNVSKHFGGVMAVNDVSMKVEKGSIYAVIGPNGAGKTTFFNTLSGFYIPDGGNVVYEGRDITKLANWQRIQLGMSRTFQTPSVFPELTVYENLLIGVQSQKKLAFRLRLPSAGRQREIDARIDELLGFVNLQHLKGRPVAELSHGGQRLCEIAMSLSVDPTLVLLDEPMAGLAEAETERIMEVIRDLHERLNLTVLFVEHNMRVVLSLAHRILVLDRGNTLAEGTPNEISNNQAVREAYLGQEVISRV
ncbi:MAG TPA: ABC transporter ATP-binding protein [Candidatus Dormibacteraeota bacterium]|nr:ABC transporter ATP-binding protein [Candidatus Dormibacteraeota bacterium]